MRAPFSENRSRPFGAFTIPFTRPKEMYEDQVDDGVLVVDCEDELVDLAVLPRGVRDLTLVECHGVTSLVGLPEGLSGLLLASCNSLESPEGLPQSLESLTIFECDGLTQLPPLSSLRELALSRPLEVCGEWIQTLDEYHTVCRAHIGGKSAYA